MPRETIADLKREVEKRDQEIGRLTSLLNDAREERAGTQAAMRLIATIVQDAQK
jgi:hypothetical protein